MNASLRKKAATYSPALPYLTQCTISVWTVWWRRFPILHKITTKKAFTWLPKWTLCLKKGGYLLSHIALFDTVYHRRMDDTVAAIFKTTQNEKDLRDFSPRPSLRKKAATYSPALPYWTRCTIGVWTVHIYSRPLKTKKARRRNKSLACSV